MSERIAWRSCRQCGLRLPVETWRANLEVCAGCGYHARWRARARIAHLVDPGSFSEADADLEGGDPLNWRAEGEAYPELLARARERTGERESYIYGRATIEGRPLWLGVFEFRFLGGTLGAVAGEKVARTLDRAREAGEPAVIFTASGGARMQEGMVSLLQMAKIATALAEFAESPSSLVTVICDPTTGGVAASLAFMGDVVLAEPGALVGFAGPRVILQTIGEEIAPGVQRSERLCRDGFIDEVVHRRDLRARIAAWLERLAL